MGKSCLADASGRIARAATHGMHMHMCGRRACSRRIACMQRCMLSVGPARHPVPICLHRECSACCAVEGGGRLKHRQRQSRGQKPVRGQRGQRRAARAVVHGKVRWAKAHAPACISTVERVAEWRRLLDCINKRLGAEPSGVDVRAEEA